LPFVAPSWSQYRHTPKIKTTTLPLMKLIYIHIPKTAGSSISKYVAQNTTARWILNTDLKDIDPAKTWRTDFLSGHFTRQELLDWIASQRLSLDGVKFATIIRHPFDQLRSNLSFPFELSARGETIEEDWMKDMLLCDPKSASDIAAVLQKHPWIFNLQWQFLITGSYPNEALSKIDYIGVYPAVSDTLRYCCDVLSLEPPAAEIHDNRSAGYAIDRDVLASPPLRDMIIDQHALDTQLFSEVHSRALRRHGMDALEKMICPFDHGRLFDSWAANRTIWL
jgi:hypothetical protein